ncbi:MAG: cytochrome b [Colwellia sp.]|nr:cytochrome b [Colwellia sp.]
MKNTDNHYGWITITLHWLIAIIIIGLFSLGYWMVDLGYYDPWYKQGPDIHRSIGIILFALMVFRLFWKAIQTKPKPLDNHSKFERVAGSLVHRLLYLFVFVIMISGYLISTADGRAIEVFQWFSVPSIGELFTDQEDIAGLVHQYLAYAMIGLVSMHAIAALKHHFIDKDKTLTRMLGNRT